MEKLIKLKKKRRQRKHGYRKRQASHSGQKTLKRRRSKGRKSLSI